MTTALVPGATLQVVHQGSSGAILRAPSAVAQVVMADISTRTRVSLVFGQVVHSGDAGSRMYGAAAAAQVVWTTGAPNATRQRAWTFDFDGHTYYALDLAENGTVVYDLLTQQWSHFETAGYGGHWNMKNGFHWRAGKKIVGGGISSGILYEMSPGTFFDDGWRPVVYEVRGVLFAGDISFHRQYALRLVGSAGRTADTISPVLNMRFSDDQGVTWSDEYSVELTADSRQRIEFRSLGAFTSPGRIFRLYDQGGVKYIAYVMAEVESENG